MIGFLIGLILGAALIGVPVLRWERQRVARVNYTTTKALVPELRRTWLRLLGAAIACTVVPTAVVLFALYVANNPESPREQPPATPAVTPARPGAGDPPLR